ncbi:sodium-dependent noradrenaline transporter-like [Rhopalosiphum maidis]|uniref:sodium-dependent noradrenaline transporter-like n=1 Tax=Rhopalosiphum maidis TaxID=43146 RepID=UPI000EFF1359|nr:sodium-dependent noradrenaline transporter-like [Rhopalosiphum maidis]XP_026820855.1 sodium-dependent noradrenaline transporter-like [Rhopalosiphum maidis]XP_026820856.1 sodium-dependent noradrenaline transporter-like [Rhopalosiphum maidis]
MTSIAAKTSAMFNNGVTSVEVVDSDNEDIGVERSGIKKLWVPTVNKFRQFFKSSPNTMMSNNKRHWRKRHNKEDTENDQYYDQDDEQDDYSDKQELHQQVDDRNGSKSHDIEEDDDDDEEDQDEDRQVRKKMLRKQNKKEVEVKKKKNTEIRLLLAKSSDDAKKNPKIISESTAVVSIVDEVVCKENLNTNINDAERETWERNADFLLSIIGFAVDLANIWRFPYLCYRNGGGAFLIPYFLMLIFGAVPLFYMELILGQYNRQGPISVWKNVCPLFKGVGFCAVLVAFYVSFYYNVIIGWSLYFLAMSTTSSSGQLPWVHCNNTWNTDLCVEQKDDWGSVYNQSYHVHNYLPRMHANGTLLPMSDGISATGSNFNNQSSPAAEYFHRGVLGMSDGLNELGYPKWQLALCVFIVYVMLYLSLFKGVKSSGIVVWGTATLPYLVLTILLIRGLMLPGSLTGITYYLQPELYRLLDTQVWVDAAVQIFYSVGAGFGVHLSYASYNNIKNNCYTDCLITTAVNCFTSFFSGFVIFTYLGFMSHKQHKPISSVATEGPGLVFQVYPEAVATLPGSNIWAMLFFFMSITLGIDSAMGGLECVITGLMDEFSGFFKNRKWPRERFTFAVIGISFCVALINVTPGGIYMLHLLDTYAAGISLLCSALFECIAVSWFYGLEKFCNDVESMIGHRPGLYWRLCWKFVSPMFIIGVVTFALIDHKPLSYNGYVYPEWAEWLGWTLAFSSILMIPGMAIVQMCRASGSFKKRLAYNITPLNERESMEKNKGECSRFRLKHWLYI